jgi:hypothetical protein
LLSPTSATAAADGGGGILDGELAERGERQQRCDQRVRNL